MVTVAFDPKLVPEPVKPKEELVIPDDPFQKAPDDPKRIAEEKAAKEKADREKAERDKQLADAEKKVKDPLRPVRGLVLRHPRRQLPRDRARPRRAPPPEDREARRTPPRVAPRLSGGLSQADPREPRWYACIA